MVHGWIGQRRENIAHLHQALRNRSTRYLSPKYIAWSQGFRVAN